MYIVALSHCVANWAGSYQRVEQACPKPSTVFKFSAKTEFFLFNSFVGTRTIVPLQVSFFSYMQESTAGPRATVNLEAAQLERAPFVCITSGGAAFLYRSCYISYVDSFGMLCRWISWIYTFYSRSSVIANALLKVFPHKQWSDPQTPFESPKKHVAFPAAVTVPINNLVWGCQWPNNSSSSIAMSSGHQSMELSK